jgi:hypothetical protein
MNVSILQIFGQFSQCLSPHAHSNRLILKNIIFLYSSNQEISGKKHYTARKNCLSELGPI